MPRYEYKCKSCDRNFEVVHGIDDNIDRCELCGGPVRRVFHPVGIVFKGSGFYATDSKRPGNNLSNPPEDKETAEKPPAKEKPEKKAEDKPPESVKAAT